MPDSLFGDDGQTYESLAHFHADIPITADGEAYTPGPFDRKPEDVDKPSPQAPPIDSITKLGEGKFTTAGMTLSTSVEDRRDVNQDHFKRLDELDNKIEEFRTLKKEMPDKFDADMSKKYMDTMREWIDLQDAVVPTGPLPHINPYAERSPLAKEAGIDDIK